MSRPIGRASANITRSRLVEASDRLPSAPGAAPQLAHETRRLLVGDTSRSMLSGEPSFLRVSSGRSLLELYATMSLARWFDVGQLRRSARDARRGLAGLPRVSTRAT